MRSDAAIPRQLALPFVHAPAYAAADFVASASNAEALAWLDLAADWPAGRLALWGEPGSGKTHLLHRWAERSGAVLLGPGGVRTLLPPRRPIAIDDAELAPETPLLRMLNAAAEAGLPALLAARAPPARWATALPDLASRLRATVAIGIGSADDALLRALLLRLLADRQLAMSEPAQGLLLTHLPRTPAALREAVARLDHLTLAAGGRVTRALAAAVVRALVAEEHAGSDDDFAPTQATLSRHEPALI